MLHGLAIIFLFMPPYGLICFAYMVGMAFISVLLAKAFLKLPRELTKNNKLPFITLPVYSALLALALGVAFFTTSAFLGLPIHSEWGLSYENAVPIAIIYYIAYAAALCIMQTVSFSQLIKKMFTKTNCEKHRQFTIIYSVLTSIFVLIMHLVFMFMFNI